MSGWFLARNADAAKALNEQRERWLKSAGVDRADRRADR
jgi:hypothetical protein